FIGAYEAGSSKIVSKRAMGIGRDIGIAFQIIDDLLDYTQNPQDFGKPVLEDIKQGVYSLPLLYALEEKRNELTPYLENGVDMTQEDILKVVEILHQTNAIEKTKTLANIYTQKALTSIERLPRTQEKTCEQLYEITKNILVRKD
ncbi:MAG: polyprenyl synthetase family protein, partial [Streptococcaceae bacterium]|nr:polyprenyl synthetase family protein [Streptococcaceae bacterium]